MLVCGRANVLARFMKHMFTMNLGAVLATKRPCQVGYESFVRWRVLIPTVQLSRRTIAFRSPKRQRATTSRRAQTVHCARVR